MEKKTLKRIKELYEYKTHINEWGKVDTSGWICVGEIPYNIYGGGKSYIMVNPKKEMKWGQEIHDIRYTDNADGSGRQTDSIPNYYKERITIYPEHMDDEYGEMFLGKRKEQDKVEQEHNEFLSKLFIVGGNVILHHNSSYKIEDGFVKKGTPNGYSNNSDIGIYFWGSRNSGNDPSGASLYTYYCVIPQKELYDFETNAERMTLPNAMKKYNYCGQYWRDSDAIVVTTYSQTPIWCILDKGSGRWFDKDWNEIRKPF